MNSKKITLLVASLAALVTTACNGNGNSSKSNNSRSGGGDGTTSDSSIYTFIGDRPYTVTFKGDTDVTEKYGLTERLRKPADPTAPSGMKFYGWKYAANGGQIWDFGPNKLNSCLGDMTLEPVFVPADQDAQVFEAELCPDIMAVWSDDVKGMDGFTYSGGSKGKGLVGADRSGEMEASGIKEFDYVRAYDSQDNMDYDKKNKQCDAVLEKDDPEVAKYQFKKEVHVDAAYGYYAHFLYRNGNTLTWEVESDKAASNVTLFARFSGEYGRKYDATGDELIDAFNDEEFPITVNGTALKYGNIQLRNIESSVGSVFLKCQDYFISANVELKQGTNIIQMKVDNSKKLTGTAGGTAPIVDCIKLYSSSKITWDKGLVTNLILQ